MVARQKDKQKASGGAGGASPKPPKDKQKGGAGGAIGRRAAEVVHLAPYEGPLTIGGITMPSYVLANTKAVLSGADIERLFIGPSAVETSEDSAAAKNRKNDPSRDRKSLESLDNFAPSKGMLARLVERLPRRAGDNWTLPDPVLFRTLENNASTHGFDADVVVDICNRYVWGMVDGTLHPKQMPAAVRAAALLTALAKAGITAAIYEATGYDRVKGESAIQDKIAACLKREAGDWSKFFFDEFFLALARIFHVTLHRADRRPHCFAAFIQRFFYQWLDPSVYEELKRRNPRPTEGKNHHQYLTPFAREKLERHQRELIVLMRSSHSYQDFCMRFAAAYEGKPVQLDFASYRPKPAGRKRR
jgi:hypothetical protein